MIIGGLVKTTLVDYPGKVAAIIFTQGCGFKCSFCYNPMLVVSTHKKLESDNSRNNTAGHPRKSVSLPTLISEDDLFLFLKKRASQLEGVVITGGEPTLHKDLPTFIKQIKKLGYLVKLDTNGTNPEMLAKIIKAKLVDYLAMDLKGPENKYQTITQVSVDFKKIVKSVKLIMASGLPYEFRTTIVPILLDSKDIEKMGQIIKNADHWYLQKFQSNLDLVNPDFESQAAYTDKDMDKIVKIGQKYVKQCAWR